MEAVDCQSFANGWFTLQHCQSFFDTNSAFGDQNGGRHHLIRREQGGAMERGGGGGGVWECNIRREWGAHVQEEETYHCASRDIDNVMRASIFRLASSSAHLTKEPFDSRESRIAVTIKQRMFESHCCFFVNHDISWFVNTYFRKVGPAIDQYTYGNFVQLTKFTKLTQKFVFLQYTGFWLGIGYIQWFSRVWFSVCPRRRLEGPGSSPKMFFNLGWLKPQLCKVGSEIALNMKKSSQAFNTCSKRRAGVRGHTQKKKKKKSRGISLYLSYQPHAPFTIFINFLDPQRCGYYAMLYYAMLCCSKLMLCYAAVDCKCQYCIRRASS